MNKIIKFYGNGCMNCKALAPHFEALKGEYTNIEFSEINTSEDKSASAKYDITTLPTLVFLSGEEEVARMAGLKPKALIIRKIQEVF